MAEIGSLAAGWTNGLSFLLKREREERSISFPDIPLFRSFFFCRFLPFLMPAGSEKTLNLNTLRTFRVLRPLKLVSGVPSE